MELPFTAKQFFEVFSNYNRAVFPFQVILVLLAMVICLLLIKKRKWTDTFIVSGLVFLWLWMGVIYHIKFFSTINKAAYLFGGAFIVQAIVLFYYGVIRKRLSFGFDNSTSGLTGGILIVYALLIYPLLGYFLGHVYPASPTFGLPCPTAIFTFGILLCSANKPPLAVLFIPFLWSLMGVSAAVQLGVYEDLGLIVAGVATMALLIKRKQGKLHGDQQF